jgi:uncharacterized DUF497 family protein
MEIVWDPAKAAANPEAHDGVTFEEATPVLFDPYVLTNEDRDARGERRFVALGRGGKGRLLVVVHTYRNDTIRIISAWRANAIQRKRYESQF